MGPQDRLHHLERRSWRAPPRTGSLAGLRRSMRRHTVQALAASVERDQRGLLRSLGQEPVPADRPGGRTALVLPGDGLPDDGLDIVFPDIELPDLEPLTTGKETPPFRFAVHTVSFIEDPERYGSLGAIVSDMVELGADVVRHPGAVQMFVERLLGHDAPLGYEGNERPYMRPVQTDWMRREDLLPVVLRSSCFRALESVVRAMVADGTKQRLMITLFDLGGGSQGPWAATDGVFFEDNRGIEPRSDLFLKPIGVAWDPAHFGRTVYDPIQGIDVPFAGGVSDVDPGAERGQVQKWALYTLDPSDAYKRVFFRELAAAVARALADLNDRLLAEGLFGPTPFEDLSDYIEGVELGNEMEAFHARQGKTDAFADAQVDAVSWGDFYYHCATAIREECDWLPVWISGITAYVESMGGPATWQQKRDFLGLLLARVDEHLVDEEIEDLVDGVDYHFYHMGEDLADGSREQALPLVLLYLETRELRQILDDYVPSATLSVVETSVNVATRSCDESKSSGDGCEEGSDSPYLSVAFRPERITCTCTDEDCTAVAAANRPDDFQAGSVWMRAAAALAGGAALAGWHDHMSSPGGSFAGCGLRMDFTPVSSSTQAYPRKSWFAFQRLTAMLGSATGVSVLSPSFGGWEDTPSAQRLRDEYTGVVALESLQAKDFLWVLEFSDVTWAGRRVGPGLVGDGPWWAYLCYVDPGSESATVAPPACAGVILVGRRTGRVAPLVYRIAPGPMEGDMVDIEASSAHGYPSRRWTGDDAEPVIARELGIFSYLSWRVSIARGGWPVLLLSSERLALGGVGVTVASP
ncbi:hypothetical protein L6R53_06140 [Myxococcota bacterium]|nr:hypothetical protein [Myxococcota bacterium]